MEHTGASSRRLERSPRDGDRRLLHPRRPGAIKSTIIYISIVLHGSQRIHLFLRLVIWLQSVFDRVLWLAHTRGAAGSTRPPVWTFFFFFKFLACTANSLSKARWIYGSRKRNPMRKRSLDSR
ncbi:hypothetical protein BHE74_00017913 [Ensete ventricosum]|nr:hypothetical protein BHE74_00017913 [Ensete ventricosum]RZR97066.1 hypothetical protein BHM03_00026190 [Ensete ventricosum]